MGLRSVGKINIIIINIFCKLQYEQLDKSARFQVLMHIMPEDVKSKKRQRKTDSEVAELREKLDLPAKSIVLSNREVRLLRHIELTEEERNKLKGSAKVAKKLEKLKGLGQEKEDSSDEDGENDNDQDYPSTESDVTSPRNSEPTSLTESMQLVDDILKDNKINRFDKIERLEAILSAAALLPLDNDNSSLDSQVNKCSCSCHEKNSFNRGLDEGKVVLPTGSFVSSGTASPIAAKENHANVETQTLSTGDIVVTKIFFNEATD